MGSNAAIWLRDAVHLVPVKLSALSPLSLPHFAYLPVRIPPFYANRGP